MSSPDVGDFVHLHLHTEYSLLDGGNQVERLVDHLATTGMKACAITDHGNIFGAVAFYEACKAKGIKPILGVEAYVTPPGKPRTDRTYAGGGEGGFHLVLLAMNNAGWKNLLHLCSQAYLTGFYYKPRIDRELLEAHSEGLIAINGHLGSEIGDHLLAFHRTNDQKYWSLALESARWHAKVFGVGESDALPRFYVELQHHVPEQNAINPLLIKLARQENIPLVCDNDAHFLRAEDHDSHDTLICISTGKGKRDDNRMRYPTELYVKNAQEMQALFAGETYNNADFGNAGLEALANTQRIARACDVTLAIGANHAPLVRVKVPAEADLPRHDDPAYGGDLTAWYKDYCSRFELSPFRAENGEQPTEEERQQTKADCDRALRMLAEGGYLWRYSVKPDPHSPDAQQREQVARLSRELSILANKNISAYFLIVWDFVNWGRGHGVPALARGSGVGTMVGYVLGLSNACPVRYGLLFERFTDPDRSEYPDIDIDLCQDGRARVIDYVRKKYGHVAQIITFGTLKARAAIKDVGRVLEIPLAEVDRITKLVPEALDTTIDSALRDEPELKGLYGKDPKVRELIDQARALEGHTRHAGVHAAGVIVATRPLHEIVPLYRAPGVVKDENNQPIPDHKRDDYVTQWDGPTCEKMGLLKMDFLGLRTISVVQRAKQLIRETMSEEEVWAAVGRADHYRARTQAPRTTGGQVALVAHPLDLDRLSFADQHVFELFRRGETTGVFQFESGGMRRLLVEMKPDRLEDLIAANALFRPGPMDLIPDYNRRKHGTEDVPRVHDIVDRYTSETYGVMVYQEQVMQIVHGLGGIKLRDAYSLIKNISKKKHDKIEKERPKFIDGAVKQGLTKDAANDLFELILKFAGYGFNKSHSTGYAIVAYQTAYLKAYFPAQYMAAFLTYESQANKVSDWIPYLEDCRRTRTINPRTGETIRVGVEVKPPDINLSDADFTVVREKDNPPHIRFGLRAIKGAADRAISAIIAERKKAGPYASLFDFCERIPAGVITKANLESLVKCGAFDAVHSRDQRAAMIASVDQAIAAGARLASDKAMGQGGLFLGAPASSTTKAPAPASILTKAPQWPETETLAHEKDALGFYVSSHPLDRWKFWSKAFASADTARLKELPQDSRVVLPAMIQSVRPIVVRNGKSAGQRMAMLTVEDHCGACDCVLFTDAFARYGHLATAENVVFVLGKLDLKRGDPQVVVDRIMPIESVPFDAGKVRLFVDENRLNGGAADALSRVASWIKGDALPDTASLAPAAASAAPAQPTGKALEGEPTRFAVEVVVGTADAVAVLAADPKIRTPLTPPLVRAITDELGEGMVRVVGAVAIEKEKPKPWERKRRDDDE